MSLNADRDKKHVNPTFAFDLKAFSSFLLALLILLQPFSKIWICLSFKIKQDDIAKSICVKKNIKNNSCKGKCYLKKQLEESEKEDQTPQDQKEKSEVPFICGTKPILVGSFRHSEKQPFTTYYSNFYKSNFRGSIFHPPQFI